MKCSVCGSELPENSKFCVFCGSTIRAAAPEAPTYTPPAPTYTPPVYEAPISQPSYAPPAYTPPAAPEAPAYTAPSYTGEEVVVPAKPVKKGKKAKKSKKGLAIVGIIAAVLAVVVIAGIVILNIPSVKVPLALSRSMNAYAGIADDLGLTDALGFWQEDKAYDSSFTLTYEGINQALLNAVDPSIDFSQFETLGIRYSESISLTDRRLSGTLAAVYKGEDLITANIGIDDDTLWFAIPELLSGKYGLNTETLGKDLAEMDPSMAEAETLGFNVFDLAELMLTLEPSEDLQKEFADAAKALSKAMEIEADGSDEIKVNGERINCSVYNVTIPQDALEDYVDAIEKPMGEYIEQYMDVLFEMYESIGMPEDVLAEMKEEITYSMDMDIFFDSLKEGLDYIGDIELELYIKGGYVMAAIYELEVDDETMVITLNMGGEDKYVNDFSVTVEMEDYFTFELSSSGNHTGKGGEYTDKTKLEINVDGETAKITSDVSYKPKEDSDNFSWELAVSGGEYGANVGLEAEGQLTVGDKSLRLQLEKLSVASMGMDMVTLGLDYSVGAYTGAEEAGSVNYITKLTEDDLMKMAEELQTNAMTFMEELMEKLPILEQLVYAQAAPYPEEYYPSDSYYG